MIERRTIEELITRYQLEPDLKDIYVEGDCDLSLINWFLKIHALENIVIYEIADVDISVRDLSAKSLENNAKGRVVCLARSLEGNIDSQQVLCITDKDFDFFLGIDHKTSLMLQTDYSCMEMYLCKKEVLKKYFRLSLRKEEKIVDAYFEKILLPLQQLFLIRLANKALCLNLTSIPFDKCLDFSSGEILFDRDEYIKRYLLKNGATSKRLEIIKTVEEFSKKLTSLPQNQINGHDFLELIRLFILKVLKIKDHALANTIDRVLFSCLELDYIKNENLFKRILLKFK